MAKKQKNPERTEAIRRVRNSNEILSDLGIGCEDELQSIGIALEHVGLSQVSICVLNNLSMFSKRYTGLDISLFVQKTVPPTKNVPCPVFSVKDLVGWKNPIITTSISTTLDALRGDCSDIYYYAFDLDFIENSHDSSKDILDCFTSKKVTVFTRSDIYREIIEREFSVYVLRDLVTNFDIVKIAKIIFGRNK